MAELSNVTSEISQKDHLSPLPNELLLLIWEFVPPQDVKRFATTSRKISSLFHDARMSSLYAHCKILVPGDATDLLEKILNDPDAARYVKELTIDDWRGPYHAVYTEKRFDLFVNTLQTSNLVPSTEANDWIDSMAAGDEDPLIALLFTRLTRLHTLHFHRIGDTMGNCLFGVVQQLAHGRPSGALSRLSMVELGDNSYLESESPGVRWVRVFAALPSVHVVDAWGRR